jgi:hypothetical protein
MEISPTYYKVRKHSLDFLVGSFIGFGLASLPESYIIPKEYNVLFKPFIPAALMGFNAFDNSKSKEEIIGASVFAYYGGVTGKILYDIFSPYI